MWSLYKKLLLVVIVVAPLYWTIMTDDGRRRVDAMMLSLFGEQELLLNIPALDPDLSPGELLAVYPDLGWRCGDTESPFGEHACVARIGTVNGVPARYASAFFRAGRLAALQVNYRPAHHNEMLRYLDGVLGEPRPEASGTQDAVLRWRIAHGMVVIARQPAGRDDAESAFLWLAGAPD